MASQRTEQAALSSAEWLYTRRILIARLRAAGIITARERAVFMMEASHEVLDVLEQIVRDYDEAHANRFAVPASIHPAHSI